MTKKIIFPALILLLVLSAYCGPNWTLNTSADLVSSWLWRGKLQHRGFALQPGVDLEMGSMCASLWASQNFGDEPSAGTAEIDYTSSYTAQCPFWEKCEITSGFYIYLYPESFGIYNEEFSAEAFTGISVDVPSAPSLTWYFDPMSGQYLELGLSHEIEASELITVSPSATAGLGLTQNSAANWSATPSVLAPGVEVTYATVVDISLTLAGQIPLHDDYKRDFFGGLGISYSISPQEKTAK